MAISVSLKAPAQPLQRERISLLGTPVDRIDSAALRQWIEAFIESGTPHQVITANLDFIAIARRRPQFARVIDAADLVICDGKPLQWASYIQGQRLLSRVTGMDLVMQTARLSAERGWRVFLLGAAPGVAARAGRELERLVPGLVIAGTYAPPLGPFDDAENSRTISLIRAARADALFVALGAPRQDEWIRTHLHKLNVSLCAGIGGVLNFLAGETRRAPTWMQALGLEWAFRLAQEPTRLWRRYLLDDLPLCFELLVHQAFVRLQRAEAQGGSLAPSRPSRSGPVCASSSRVRTRADLAEMAKPLSTQDMLSRSGARAPRVRKRACRSVVSEIG